MTLYAIQYPNRLEVLRVSAEFVGVCIVITFSNDVGREHRFPFPLEALVKWSDSDQIREQLRDMLAPRASEDDAMLIKDLLQQIAEFPKVV